MFIGGECSEIGRLRGECCNLYFDMGFRKVEVRGAERYLSHINIGHGVNIYYD
jgi:hypothetical protein